MRKYTRKVETLTINNKQDALCKTNKITIQPSINPVIQESSNPHSLTHLLTHSLTLHPLPFQHLSMSACMPRQSKATAGQLFPLNPASRNWNPATSLPLSSSPSRRFLSRSEAPG